MDSSAASTSLSAPWRRRAAMARRSAPRCGSARAGLCLAFGRRARRGGRRRLGRGLRRRCVRAAARRDEASKRWSPPSVSRSSSANCCALTQGARPNWVAPVLNAPVRARARRRFHRHHLGRSRCSRRPSRWRPESRWSRDGGQPIRARLARLRRRRARRRAVRRRSRRASSCKTFALASALAGLAGFRDDHVLRRASAMTQRRRWA